MASGFNVRQKGKCSSPSGVSILFSSSISGLSFTPSSVQNLVNAFELLLGMGMAHVQHVQQQIGMNRLLPAWL